jgi:hypothetical protein
MDNLVGTQSCPHLGFDLQGGRPCCHADDFTRMQCGKFAPNPAARHAGASGQMSGVEAYFCTVLGTDSLPPEALRLAAAEKAKARRQAASEGPKFRPPSEASGHKQSLPDREAHDEFGEPIIPTHTLRAEGRQIQPNERCPCGSGKKYKKCCGR